LAKALVSAELTASGTELSVHVVVSERSTTGFAAKMNDLHAANEDQFGFFGCLMASVSVTKHSAGWLKGRPTVS
jgi:trimethylamine--corrinoid protein Co-methyltransferase